MSDVRAATENLNTKPSLFVRIVRVTLTISIALACLSLFAGFLFSGMLGPRISGFVAKLVNPGHPWSETVPYKFEFTKIAAKCSVKLPNDSGRFTYMHVLDGCDRSLTLTTKNYKNKEMPLIYSCSEKVDFKVYWYPEAKGTHSYLRLVGPGADSVIDLSRGKSMLIRTTRKRIFASDFNNEYDVCEQEYDASGKVVDKPKRPELELTSIFAGRGKYLGRIISEGNRLKFTSSH